MLGRASLATGSAILALTLSGLWAFQVWSQSPGSSFRGPDGPTAGSLQSRGSTSSPANSEVASAAQASGPAYRVADHTVVSPILAALLASARPNEHPLMPAIRWAKQELENVRRIEDYSAIVVKRERIGGELSEEEYAFVKIRHRPFSVYMRFLHPPSIRGQEVIWVEGANDGKMWARGTGLKRVFGTVSLSPTSPIVMQNNRYPITEIGILRLVERIIEVAEHDAQYGECEVTYYPGAKINDRPCLCIQVVHPVPRVNFRFHIARVFVDEELRLPVRYESYDWPAKPGGPPLLLEQYTYLNIRLNNGFTDRDFDINNPEYGFTGRK